MRKFLLAAVATAAVATPAIARDGSPYIGADIGVMKPQDTKLAVNVDVAAPIGSRHYGEGFVVDHNTTVQSSVDLALAEFLAARGYPLPQPTDDGRRG